jgi:hypothetical protein
VKTIDRRPPVVPRLVDAVEPTADADRFLVRFRDGTKEHCSRAQLARHDRHTRQADYLRRHLGKAAVFLYGVDDDLVRVYIHRETKCFEFNAALAVDPRTDAVIASDIWKADRSDYTPCYGHIRLARTPAGAVGLRLHRLTEAVRQAPDRLALCEQLLQAAHILLTQVLEATAPPPAEADEDGQVVDF